MDKIFGYVFPAVAVIAILGALFGYVHITAKGSPQLTSQKVLDDKSYLSENKEKYADCHYTLEVVDLSKTIINGRYAMQGVSEEKIQAIEKDFMSSFEQQCSSLLQDYRTRYSQYEVHKKEAAEAELSQLDKWLGREVEVISEPSPIFSLYQEYDPKSLQHPTNPNAKMLYTQEEYEDFVLQRL